MNFSWSRLGRLTRKELRETLRDRRTILTLVLMPLLVYPLLSMALNRFLLSSGGPAADGFVVGVATEPESLVLNSILQDPRSQPPPEIAEASGGGIAEFRVVVTGEQSVREALIDNQLDVGLEMQVAGQAGEVGSRSIVVIAYAGDQASLSARRILIERMQWLKLNETAELVREFKPEFPFIDVSADVVGTAESGSMLGSVIPLVLVLMTITGAVYPAIDLTAGERERGTMEALMASPVPRGQVLFAKYAAVVTVALMTAVMNLLAMFVTLSLTGLMSQLVGDGGGFGILALLKVFGLLVLFSTFFSAMLLSLTSFAKSFKEAQAYLIPVMLLSLGPAMLSLMPGIQLNGPLAIVPLVNIVILARDVLSGATGGQTGGGIAGGVVAIVSTLLYAAAALGVAAKLFGSDAVTRTSEQSIGSLLRRPRDGAPVPSLTAAGLVLAILLPASFLVSNGLSRWIQSGDQTPDIALQLIFNAVGLVLAFGIVPLAATVLGRHRLIDTYRVYRPTVLAILGAGITSLGAWAFAHELVVLADQFGFALLSDDQLEKTREVLEKWKEVPSWLLLLTLAVAPAVIEEACFRGYLFSAFRTRLGPGQTILVTAFLFGLFHVFVGSTLLIERFLPTTMLGIILGYVAWRTNSVWPGIVLHFCHNAMLEMVAKYHERLEFLSTGYDDSSHLPATWLVTAGVLVIIGLGVVRFSTPRPEPESSFVTIPPGTSGL